MCRTEFLARCWWLSAILLAIPVGGQAQQSAEAGAPQAALLPPILVPLQGPYRVVHDPGAPRFLSFSSDGSRLASSNTNDEIHVFDLRTANDIFSWNQPESLDTSLGELVWPWCPQADGAWQTPGRWRLTAVPGRPHGWPGKAAAMFMPARPGEVSELALIHNACLSNSHVIVKAGDDLSIKPGVWLLGSYIHFFAGPRFKRTMTLETEAPEWLPLTTTILHGLPAVSAAAVSAESGTLATGFSDGSLVLWTQTGSRLQTVSSDTAEIHAVAFSPRGDLLATVGDSGIVRLWALPSLQPVGEFADGRDEGYWMGFSPEGDRLVVASGSGTLRVWDVTNNRLERVIAPRQLGDKPQFVYGSDRNTVLFATTQSNGGAIGAVDVSLGRVTMNCPVDLGRITAFASSPRNDLLAAADEQGTIFVWQVQAPG